jgi:hypothetical protein
MAGTDDSKTVAVIEDRTHDPDPQGKEKNAAHNPVGLKAESEGKQASSQQEV